MRGAIAIVLLLALIATPLASATITIDRIELPDRTMAGKAFPASVEITNDGAARTVYIFAALYAPREDGAPCGPSTDPRFRGFTHLLQEAVRVPAGATLRYPTSGDWLQRYERDEVEAAPATYEFCVFVANASAGQAIAYEAFATTDIPVRGVNALPVAGFTWEPERPRATEDVRFRASGSDGDGDPVSFTWDFGFAKASGRAVAEGESPTTFFFPAGEFEVTLTASDELEESRVTRTIRVDDAAPSPDGDGGGPLGIPLPAWAPMIAVALAAIMGIRRERARA